jgi:hypothetical protein
MTPFCALLASLHCVGTGFFQHDATATQAAQVTLLVLRATVHAGPLTRTYVIRPSPLTLSLSQAGLVIARVKKPATCTGEMQATTLVVTCRPLSDAEALAHQQRVVRHLDFLAGDVRKHCGEPMRQASLLLLGGRGGGSMTVSFYALAEWLRDYDMNFSLGGGSTAQLPEGVCMVFDVGGSPTMKVEGTQGPAPS